MDQPGSLGIGATVRLVEQLPYLKSADPMPMLRPADLVGLDEIGQVVALRPADQLAVRFRRGTFLIARASLQPV
ncbi:MAG: NAD(P)H dehydrogenase assembly family protein [Cyanobacteriota bacterium]|nr:NAD(P)H dehydrogenase assembly family protein [Cyanobacteriota bacterium]